eukprot:TRINITY_DN8612_c0_g1_i18.p1 TRINITY_DN8612_c0_g1~~TRINITY_DN8612_c0_g1_i18.p1  ORF type:complete len:188 (-),score=-10.59 TRINITY_DN8612_c0_g1_i18:694-1257(-)
MITVIRLVKKRPLRHHIYHCPKVHIAFIQQSILQKNFIPEKTLTKYHTKLDKQFQNKNLTPQRKNLHMHSNMMKISISCSNQVSFYRKYFSTSSTILVTLTCNNYSFRCIKKNNNHLVNKKHISCYARQNFLASKHVENLSSPKRWKAEQVVVKVSQTNYLHQYKFRLQSLQPTASNCKQSLKLGHF